MKIKGKLNTQMTELTKNIGCHSNKQKREGENTQIKNYKILLHIYNIFNYKCGSLPG